MSRRTTQQIVCTILLAWSVYKPFKNQSQEVLFGSDQPVKERPQTKDQAAHFFSELLAFGGGVAVTCFCFFLKLSRKRPSKQRAQPVSETPLKGGKKDVTRQEIDQYTKTYTIGKYMRKEEIIRHIRALRAV